MPECTAITRPAPARQAATSFAVRSGCETSSPAFCTTKAPVARCITRLTCAVSPRFAGLRLRITRCGPE